MELSVVNGQSIDCNMGDGTCKCPTSAPSSNPVCTLKCEDADRYSLPFMYWFYYFMEMTSDLTYQWLIDSLFSTPSQLQRGNIEMSIRRSMYRQMQWQSFMRFRYHNQRWIRHWSHCQMFRWRWMQRRYRYSLWIWWLPFKMYWKSCMWSIRWYRCWWCKIVSMHWIWMSLCCHCTWIHCKTD